MNLKDALIAWNPESDQIRVGSLVSGKDQDWTLPYGMTGGAAYIEVRSMTGQTAKMRVMSDFIGIVVRDGVCAQAAHREFSKIEEYCEAVPQDMFGWGDAIAHFLGNA
jgi:hypothetical protein